MKLTIQAGFLISVSALSTSGLAVAATEFETKLAVAVKNSQSEISHLQQWELQAGQLLPQPQNGKKPKNTTVSPALAQKILTTINIFPLETAARDEATRFFLESEFDLAAPYDDSWDWESLQLRGRTQVHLWARLSRLVGEPGIKVIVPQAWQLLRGYPSFLEVMAVYQALMPVGSKQKKFMDIFQELQNLQKKARDSYGGENAELVKNCLQDQSFMKKIKCSKTDELKLRKLRANSIRVEIEQTRPIARRLMAWIRESGILK